MHFRAAWSQKYLEFFLYAWTFPFASAPRENLQGILRDGAHKKILLEGSSYVTIEEKKKKKAKLLSHASDSRSSMKRVQEQPTQAHSIFALHVVYL